MPRRKAIVPFKEQESVSEVDRRNLRANWMEIERLMEGGGTGPDCNDILPGGINVQDRALSSVSEGRVLIPFDGSTVHTLTEPGLWLVHIQYSVAAEFVSVGPPGTTGPGLNRIMLTAHLGSDIGLTTGAVSTFGLNSLLGVIPNIGFSMNNIVPMPLTLSAIAGTQAHVSMMTHLVGAALVGPTDPKELRVAASIPQIVDEGDGNAPLDMFHGYRNLIVHRIGC